MKWDLVIANHKSSACSTFVWKDIDSIFTESSDFFKNTISTLPIACPTPQVAILLRLWTIKLLTIQSKFINLCFTSKRLIHDRHVHATNKFVYFLNYSKTFKAVHKNNLQTRSLQQNKKAVLPFSKYPLRSQGQ